MRNLLPQDFYEWIVVDNNSSVNLSSELDCVYLRQLANIGFGAGCNVGAEIAKGENLFFVNPDCEFIEDCVTPLIKALEHNPIAGPQVLYPDGSLQLSFGPFLSIAGEAKQKLLQRLERTTMVQSWLRNQAPQNPDYVSGCAMMIRAPEFRILGGFDENFFLYNEDVDLCKRAHEKGLRTAYISQARIQHIKGNSARYQQDRVSLEFRKSQVLYYRKHHGSLQNFLLRIYLHGSRKMPNAAGST